MAILPWRQIDALSCATTQPDSVFLAPRQARGRGLHLPHHTQAQVGGQPRCAATPLAIRRRNDFSCRPPVFLPTRRCRVTYFIATCRASNCSRVWLARTMDETEYHLLLVRVASRVPVGLGVLYCMLSPLCMFAIGGVMLMFYPSFNRDWAAWFAFAFFPYGFVIATYGSLAFLRYRREGIALNKSSNSMSA